MKGFNACKSVCTNSSKNCTFSDGLLCKNHKDLSSNRPKGHLVRCDNNTCNELRCMPFNSAGTLFDCVTDCFDYSVNPISVDYSVDYNVDCEQYDISLQPKVINVGHKANTGVTCDNVNSRTKTLDCNYSSDGFNVPNGIKDHVNNFDCLYHNPVSLSFYGWR
jgi:hypothetical protein